MLLLREHHIFAVPSAVQQGVLERDGEADEGQQSDDN